jgi:hypothetical protein
VPVGLGWPLNCSHFPTILLSRSLSTLRVRSSQHLILIQRTFLGQRSRLPKLKDLRDLELAIARKRLSSLPRPFSEAELGKLPSVFAKTAEVYLAALNDDVKATVGRRSKRPLPRRRRAGQSYSSCKEEKSGGGEATRARRCGEQEESCCEKRRRRKRWLRERRLQTKLQGRST